MDHKYYISVEAARLLREKGYDKPTDYIYVIDGPFYSIWRNKGGNMESNYYPVTTRAEAIDWLEQKHGIRIEIRMLHCKVKGDPMEIKDTDEYAWRWFYAICIGDDVDNPILEEESEGSESVKLFNSRSEAEDAAIIRALKEITKKKLNYN